MTDTVTRYKKRCVVCGCYMYHDMPEDICEVCLDDLVDSESDYEGKL